VQGIEGPTTNEGFCILEEGVCHWSTKRTDASINKSAVVLGDTFNLLLEATRANEESLARGKSRSRLEGGEGVTFANQ